MTIAAHRIFEVLLTALITVAALMTAIIFGGSTPTSFGLAGIGALITIMWTVGPYELFTVQPLKAALAA